MVRRKFLRFVEELSMASGHAELERVFLEGFGRVIDAPMYALHLFDPENGRVMHNWNVNVSDACIARYEREPVAENPLLTRVLKTGRAAYNIALMSVEEWLTTPVYRNALRLHDMRHVIMAPVIDTRGVVGTSLEPHLNDTARRLVTEVVSGEEHLDRLIARPKEQAGGFSRRVAIDLVAGGRGVLHAHSSHARRDNAGLITVLELEREQPKRSHGPLNPLTAREREIAILVTEGLSNRDIAERLHLSHHTVSQHVKRIYRKLHVDSRVALTRLLLTPLTLSGQG